MITVEVIAPPGRLGVVFKGDETGPGHSVHKVRDSSDLAGQLLPGDMVVSVNEIDTSTYDHDQMAALLSSPGITKSASSSSCDPRQRVAAED